MDPVSTIASVITLVGATGGTIKVIHDTITSIKDAPKDIRRQCKRLECLCVTLNSIVRTCQHLPDDCQVDIDLCGIEEFIEEAQVLEANLSDRRTRVAGRNIAKLHESCKWLLFDRQLKRFFESLDQWDSVLPQALLVVQIALSNRILTHTSSLISLSHFTLPTPAIAPQTSIVPHYDTQTIERGDIGYLQQQLSSKELYLSDCSDGGYSLLHFAVGYNRPAIVSMLINEGLEADVRNDCGQTPLHVAVQQDRDFECARLLLKHGADAFQQDAQGRSALHYFYNEVVRQLLLYYADEIDPWMQDQQGRLYCIGHLGVVDPHMKS
ncbi:uncharacterized protein ALTATR162_LOCUS6835 [Alternaria atra]|uniref:Ankyrin n=1 Tax=Alternaria atra TaxID=119953 RepID=A0A8J2N116_9PLEO|nr:uncharacterized protein ALTATR162_LOCUS6835 [Alternaria atra]CAG5165756.1 unnamed protein product [Alternaria atra]